MDRWHLCLLATVLVVIPRMESAAQDRESRVSFRMGMIRNTQDRGIGQPIYAPYPEVEVTTKLLRGPAWTISGGAYSGYWWDGVDEPSTCQDCTTFAYRGWLLGARLYVTMDRLVIPLEWAFGITRQSLSSERIDRSTMPTEGAEGSFTATEVGLQTRIPIANRWEVLGGNRIFFRERDPDSLRLQSFRWAWFVGAAYAF